MAFPNQNTANDGSASTLLLSKALASGVTNAASLSQLGLLQELVCNLLFDSPPAQTISTTASVTFGTLLSSATALATPGALVATTFSGFASTVSGAAIMGFGTTNDVALMNRAGTVVLGIGPNTTAVNMAGALAITGALTGVTTIAVSSTATITSASAAALAVGLAGATNPAFVVDSSTGSQAAGLKITGAIAAGTVAIAVISSGAAANLTINALGTGGTIGIGTVSTGMVSIGRGSLRPVTQSTTTTALGTVQNSTPTAAQIVGGVLTQTSATGAGTVTLDNGTNISSAVAGAATGDTFEVTFTNLGGTFTLTITSATGATVVGNGAVPTGKSAKLLFVCTGPNAWNVYVTVSA